MVKLLVYALLMVFTIITGKRIYAMPELPKDKTWYTYNSSDTVFIFVHGIFSNSAECWTSDNKTFWPELLSTDPRFNQPSIYLGGYSTGFSSGDYGIKNAADELLQQLTLISPDSKPALRDKPNIIFVAHSTGGIVVRYMLERYKDYFYQNNVGLVLLASPSKGSAWANRFKLLRKIYGNRMAGELEKNNPLLLDLESRFADFVSDKSIRLAGIEAFEHHFIVPGFLFNTTYVVNPEDSAPYFGAFKIIPDKDHFSISKPTSVNDDSHTLLYDFYITRFKPLVANTEHTNYKINYSGISQETFNSSKERKVPFETVGLLNRKIEESIVGTMSYTEEDDTASINAAVSPIETLTFIEGNKNNITLEEQINKYKEIEARLDKWLDIEPLANEAIENFKTGGLTKAEEKLRQALENKLKVASEKRKSAEKDDKSAAKYAFELAAIKELQLEYLEARKYYKQATELNPENDLYFSNYGSILNMLGEYKNAIENYEKALVINKAKPDSDHLDTRAIEANIKIAQDRLAKEKAAAEKK